MPHPTLTISPQAVAANWRALDAMGPAETAAAIKADAYGLGVARIAPALWDAGCRRFFVAAAAEVTPLRAALGARAGDARIYVLNGAADGLEAMLAQGARPVLGDAAEAAAVIAAAKDGPALPCALQIETGMNRMGADVAELERILALPGLDRLDVEIIMSHLAAADQPAHPLNRTQKQSFDRQLARLRPLFPRALASLSATGGALLGADYAYDLTRPGIGLYGGLPFRGARPAVGLSAPILRVWQVAPGQTSGYAAGWTARRPSRLATIPLGYADGLPRTLADRGEAKIHGRIIPFAGRVSMDLIVLDVTDIAPPPREGETAVLLDAELTIDRMAERAGTIGYEILTRLDAARRLERREGSVA